MAQINEDHDQGTITSIFQILKTCATELPDTSLSPYVGMPFHSLIVCLLSTRTREEKTSLCATRLFLLADNPYAMSGLSRDEIREAIIDCAFYNSKTEQIVKVCKQIINNEGKVPSNKDKLLSFEGVGPKIAILTLANGYGYTEDIGIDTHVIRMSRRLGILDDAIKSMPKIQYELQANIPKEYWYDCNNIMVRFGREVCTPRKPKCEICPIYGYCPSKGTE
ncbi:MAG: endonuclease III [Ardenticatenaceae bacterium]|nr:endonuclease III [Ardenticatenaceae bacterium]